MVVSQKEMADKSCYVPLPKMGSGGSSGVPTAKSSDYLFRGASNKDCYIPMHDKQESRLPKSGAVRAVDGAKPCASEPKRQSIGRFLQSPRTGAAATTHRTSDYFIRRPAIEEYFFPMDQKQGEPFLNRPAPAVKRTDHAKPLPSKPKPNDSLRRPENEPGTRTTASQLTCLPVRSVLLNKKAMMLFLKSFCA